MKKDTRYIPRVEPGEAYYIVRVAGFGIARMEHAIRIYKYCYELFSRKRWNSSTSGEIDMYSVAAVFTAGRIQGIREERARRRAGKVQSGGAA